MAFLLKGADVSRAKKASITKRTEALKAKGVNPALCIVMAGDREDAHAYAKSASKALSGCGIRCHLAKFPEDIKEKLLLKEIEAINSDRDFHGILIMRPLPGSIGWEKVEDIVSPEKDIDCITTQNLAKVFKGDNSGFYPNTARAVVEMLDYYDIETEGRTVAIVGRSLVVGKPLAMLLLQRNATVTLCHSKTKDIDGITSVSDIIVVAAGVPHLLKAKSVKKESIVLDVGINAVDGKLIGDVDFDGVEPLVSMITPVPGGVGSVTTSMLMDNVVTAAERLTSGTFDKTVRA